MAIDLNLRRRSHGDDTTCKFTTAKVNRSKNLEYLRQENNIRGKIVENLQRQRYEIIYLRRQTQAVVKFTTAETHRGKQI